MERLSLLDSEFLYAEDAATPLHIGGTPVFEGPVPSMDEAVAFFASKLDGMPRYRQRVQELPLALGRPVWLDDPTFDLSRHLRRATLPAPGRDRELRALLGHLFSVPLARDRPLWEACVIDGFDDGRWAFAMKVHHCMVDGISGVELLGNLLDEAKDAHLEPPAPWHAAEEPTSAALVADALVGLASDGARWAKRLAELAGHPHAASGAVSSTRDGVRDFVRGLEATTGYSIAGSIGAERRYAHATVDLEDVRAIRETLGGTINDVALAVTAGAYRILLAQRDELDVHATLRTIVPVSVRRTEHGTLANHVSATLCDLPVDREEPIDRLAAICEAMSARKGSHMVEAAEWATEIGDLAPPMLVFPLTRLAALAMHHAPQRSVHTIVTNVPGPRAPLYFLGRRMVELHPYVPILSGLRTGVAIVSYDDRLFFGITGDYDTMPDLDVLAVAIELEAKKLRDRASARATSKTRH